MPIDIETVRRMARLARLEVEDAAGGEGGPSPLARLAEEMADIVAQIDILNEADAAGVEPLYSPLTEIAPPRPDEPGSGADPEDLLALAPGRSGRFFAVPKVL